MTDLVIVVGLQGSGKSSFVEKLAPAYEVVSGDRLPRGSGRARQLRQIDAAMTAGRSVVVDNTNASRAWRAELITLGRRHGARVIGYYFDTSLAECLERNRQRFGRARVPEVAIYATAKRLVRPSPAEGFDALYVVRADATFGFCIGDWTGG